MQKFKELFALKKLVLVLGLGALSAHAELTCRTIPELFKFYLVNHVAVRTLNDELRVKTIEQYLKNLDPSKTMLLQSDVEKIKKDLKKSFENMSNGNCSALDETEQVLIKRSVENELFAKSFLGDKYKLDENVEFMLDPDKRQFPKTQAEREELMKKFIHFQVSNYLSTDIKLPEAKTQLIHRYELITKRLRERKQDEVFSIFTDSFANALDPHSTYFSKDKLEDFQIEMGLSLEGIGASLSSQDGYTVVEEIIPGGAADRAKVLLTKDKIVGVAQDKEPMVNVIDMDLRDVVKLIRGKKGTKVRLNVLRQGKKTERSEVAIVRDKVDLKDQAAKIDFEKHKVGNKTYKFGVIDFPSFYEDTENGKRSSYNDMKALLDKAHKEKVDGLILNLSRNGGGALDDAVRISGLFIKQGPIVATKGNHDNIEPLVDKDEGISYSGPLVLVTSRVSASASEILAGALKDYKRAVVVGADHTFGKGTVQAVIPLPRDLGAIKVTTGMFFIPSGNSTQHQGVAGDVIVPSILNNDEIGEKALPNSLPPQKIPAFLGTDANFASGAQHWIPIETPMVQILSKNSQDRIAKNPKFLEIKKDIEEAEKNQGMIKLAEVRKKSEADSKKKKADESKTIAQRIHDADAPLLTEAENVLTDLIQVEASAKSGAPVMMAGPKDGVPAAAPKGKED